jgi:hypothetical protein
MKTYKESTFEVSKVAEQVVRALLENSDCIKATKFMGERVIVRATRKLYGKKIDKHGNIEIMLTIGEPNFQEEKFIKQCKKSGEPFPVKKIQIKILTLPKKG